MVVTADDRLVWDLQSGSTIKAAQDKRMDQSGEKVFSAGRSYRVESMHPIAQPAFVRVKNDLRELHRLEAAELRAYFGR